MTTLTVFSPNGSVQIQCSYINRWSFRFEIYLLVATIYGFCESLGYLFLVRRSGLRLLRSLVSKIHIINFELCYIYHAVPVLVISKAM